jgi:hypothetical protein
MWYNLLSPTDVRQWRLRHSGQVQTLSALLLFAAGDAISVPELLRPVTDADIQQSAAGMIRAYPDNAELQCKAIISKMSQHSDKAVAAVWQRMLAAARNPSRDTC